MNRPRFQPPAVAPQSELVVRAVSLPRPYAWLALNGHVPTIDLHGVDEFPICEGGVIVVLHAQELYDDEVRAAWADSGVVAPGPDDCPTGLVGMALVRSLTWPHEGGAWMAELDGPIAISPPVAVKGRQGLYQLPDNLASRVAGAWEERAEID